MAVLSITMIVSGSASQTVQSVGLATVADVTMSRKADGSGTIAFGPVHPFATVAGGSWPGAGRFAPSSFELLPDVEGPYRIICQARQS